MRLLNQMNSRGLDISSGLKTVLLQCYGFAALCSPAVCCASVTIPSPFRHCKSYPYLPSRESDPTPTAILRVSGRAIVPLCRGDLWHCLGDQPWKEAGLAVLKHTESNLPSWINADLLQQLLGHAPRQEDKCSLTPMIPNLFILGPTF